MSFFIRSTSYTTVVRGKGANGLLLRTLKTVTSDRSAPPSRLHERLQLLNGQPYPGFNGAQRQVELGRCLGVRFTLHLDFAQDLSLIRRQIAH